MLVKDFLVSKLSNMIKWLTPILKKDHKCIQELERLLYNYPQFVYFIAQMELKADEFHFVDEAVISEFLKNYDVDFYNFDVEQQDKFTRYISCFIDAYRTGKKDS